MQAVLEGLLFLAGDEGIGIDALLEVLELDQKNLNRIFCDLEKEYSKSTRGLCLELLGNKVKLVTKKEHNDYYEKYFSFAGDGTLSNAALEVLAIIVYNEPVTRNDIDEVRGVSSSHLVRKLLSKNLIAIKGKADLPGRPNLYGVTERFFDYFGISSKEELPILEENTEIEKERDLYYSKYNEMDIDI